MATAIDDPLTLMLTTADLDVRKRRKPFPPFRILTHSGESFDVRDSRMLMVGVRDVLIGFPTRRDPEIYERTERVVFSEIAGIDDLPPATMHEA